MASKNSNSTKRNSEFIVHLGKCTFWVLSNLVVNLTSEYLSPCNRLVMNKFPTQASAKNFRQSHELTLSTESLPYLWAQYQFQSEKTIQ